MMKGCSDAMFRSDLRTPSLKPFIHSIWNKIDYNSHSFSNGFMQALFQLTSRNVDRDR